MSLRDAKLTFSIPFYKNREYLKKTIRSVLGQTISGWEIWVCDGQETDHSIAALTQSYQDSRIHYTKKPSPCSMAQNWNDCIQMATSDLVCVLHGDDELMPKYSTILIRASEMHPQAAALFCGATIIDASGNNVFSFPDFMKRFLSPVKKVTTIIEGEAGLSALLRGNFIFCPTLCYRKSLLPPELFSPNWGFVVDLECITRIILQGKTLVGIPETHFKYRRHADNVTHQQTRTGARFREEFLLYEELYKKCLLKGWLEAAKHARRKNIIRLHSIYRSLKDFFFFLRRAECSCRSLHPPQVPRKNSQRNPGESERNLVRERKRFTEHKYRNRELEDGGDVLQKPND